MICTYWKKCTLVMCSRVEFEVMLGLQQGNVSGCDSCRKIEHWQCSMKPLHLSLPSQPLLLVVVTAPARAPHHIQPCAVHIVAVLHQQLFRAVGNKMHYSSTMNDQP